MKPDRGKFSNFKPAAYQPEFLGARAGERCGRQGKREWATVHGREGSGQRAAGSGKGARGTNVNNKAANDTGAQSLLLTLATQRDLGMVPPRPSVLHLQSVPLHRRFLEVGD